MIFYKGLDRNFCCKAEIQNPTICIFPILKYRLKVKELVSYHLDLKLCGTCPSLTFSKQTRRLKNNLQISFIFFPTLKIFMPFNFVLVCLPRRATSKCNELTYQSQTYSLYSDLNATFGKLSVNMS